MPQGISFFHSLPQEGHDSKGRNAELIKKNSHGETIQQSINTFDLNDQRTDLTHTVFDGTKPIKTIAHHWDYGPMGRVERIIEAGIKETNKLYDSKGRLQTIIKPNGDHDIARVLQLPLNII